MSAAERIWIEHGDECPYFYEEDELHEVGSAVTEFVRADIAERQLAEVRAELKLAIAESEFWRVADKSSVERAEAAEAERDRLAAENEAMREGLEPFVQHYEPWMDEWPDDTECSVHSRHTFGQLRRARAALDTAKGTEK